MFLRIFTGACAISLLLGCAAFILWATSFGRTLYIESQWTTADKTEYGPMPIEWKLRLAIAHGSAFLQSSEDHLPNYLDPSTGRLSTVKSGWPTIKLDREDHAIPAHPWRTFLSGGWLLISDRFRMSDHWFVERVVLIPCWTVVPLLGFTPAAYALVRFLRSRRKVAGRCIRCGYDLRASNDRCPECGTPIRSTEGLT